MSGSEVAALSGAVIAILGGLIAVFGAAVALKDARARRNGIHTTGVVVANVYGAGHARSGQPLETIASRPGDVIRFESLAMGFPRVEFANASGETVAFTSSVGSRPPTHAVGDTVRLYYDPRDPRRAEIAGEGKAVALFMIIFGLAIAGIGIAIRAFSRS